MTEAAPTVTEASRVPAPVRFYAYLLHSATAAAWQVASEEGVLTWQWRAVYAGFSTLVTVLAAANVTRDPKF
jgi:hypothetical protein